MKEVYYSEDKFGVTSEHFRKHDARAYNGAVKRKHVVNRDTHQFDISLHNGNITIYN